MASYGSNKGANPVLVDKTSSRRQFNDILFLFKKLKIAMLAQIKGEPRLLL